MTEITQVLALVKSATDTFGMTPYILASVVIALVGAFIYTVVKNK